MGLCQKLLKTLFFMYCTLMDSDVYSADAPLSIYTLLSINALAMYGCAFNPSSTYETHTPKT